MKQNMSEKLLRLLESGTAYRKPSTSRRPLRERFDEVVVHEFDDGYKWTRSEIPGDEDSLPEMVYGLHAPDDPDFRNALLIVNVRNGYVREINTTGTRRKAKTYLHYLPALFLADPAIEAIRLNRNSMVRSADLSALPLSDVRRAKPGFTDYMDDYDDFYDDDEYDDDDYYDPYRDPYDY